MSESGSELRNNNEQIVKLMALLKRERHEMNFLIAKQEEEKKLIETEIEKLTFKLSLLTKSLAQRMQAKVNYDRTIKAIEETYNAIVGDSAKLLGTLTKEVDVLEEIMDKKTNTANTAAHTTQQVKKTPPSRKQIETPPEPPPPPEEEEEIGETTSPSSNSGGSVLSVEENGDDDENGDEDKDEVKSGDLTEDIEREELVMSHNSEVARKIAAKRLSADDGSPGGSRRMSSDNPVKKFAIHQEAEKPTSQPPPSKKAAFPVAPPINRDSESDAELQSFREAYGRQHKANSPPSIQSGASPNLRRGSNGRKPAKR